VDTVPRILCENCYIVVCLLYFSFWPLYSLVFFDVRILITPLVSSNSSRHNHSYRSFVEPCPQDNDVIWTPFNKTSVIIVIYIIVLWTPFNKSSVRIVIYIIVMWIPFNVWLPFWHLLVFVFCTFPFGHCIVCSFSMYGFWLPLLYLQTFLSTVSGIVE
jgi:hypothetical protein